MWYTISKLDLWLKLLIQNILISHQIPISEVFSDQIIIHCVIQV